MGNTAVPVVIFKKSQEFFLQLFLSVFIKGIFSILAIDKHGIVPLLHAEQDDDSIPSVSYAKLVVVVELVGDFKHTAISIFCVIIHHGKIDAAMLAVGNVLGPGLQLLPLFMGEKVTGVEYMFHIRAIALLNRFGRFGYL